MAEQIYGGDKGVFKVRGDIDSDTKYDDAKSTGLYRVASYTSGKGYPNNGILSVIAYPNENIAFQIFANFDGNTRVRIYWFGSWRGWRLAAGE